MEEVARRDGSQDCERDMSRDELQAICDSQMAALGWLFQGRDCYAYTKVEYAYKGTNAHCEFWIEYWHKSGRICCAENTRQAGDSFGLLLATIEAAGKRIYQLKEG